MFPAATVTIGDGTAEDTKLVYNGNAQDFYIGLDDSADDLVMGLGSTVGTTPGLVIDGNLDVYLTAAKKLYLDGGGNTYISEASSDRVEFYVGGSERLRITTTEVQCNQNLLVSAASKLYLDGGTNTYISEYSGDRIGLYCNNILQIDIRTDEFLVNQNATFQANLSMNADDLEIKLGTGADASLLYNGTHVVFKPNDVGSGALIVTKAAGSLPSLNAATTLIVQRNSATGNDVILDLLAGTAGDSILNFSDSGYQGAGAITYDHSTPFMKFGVGENTEWMRCDAATGRNVGIGLSDAEQQLQVKDATYGFQIESSAATKNPAIVYETTDGIRWVNGMNIAEAGTDAFEFRYGGSVFALRLAADGGVVMPNLPTSDPSVAGELWNDSGTVKISS